QSEVAPARFAQRQRVRWRVGVAAGLDRFQGPGAQQGTKRPRDFGLAHAGVGAGDEIALQAVASATASRTPSARKSISAGAMASGGISTTTLPSGRSISSRLRAAVQTRSPMR